MIPNPPIWTRPMITTSPKDDQYVGVSTTTRPVTQMADVEVKIAVRNGARSPLSVANGSMSRPAPIRMPIPKAATTNCAGWRRASQALRYANTTSSSRTATGMISRRPIHMSTIMIPFETSLKGANEPIGPAKPNAGPTFPRVVADAATAANGESSRSTRCASMRSRIAPATKMPT